MSSCSPRPTAADAWPEHWPRTWPMSVRDVCAAEPADYPRMAQAWAASVTAALAALVLLAACDGAGTGPGTAPGTAPVPIPARDGSPLQSDALDYELRYASPTQYLGRAVVTYQNAGSAPIYLDRLSPSARAPLFELTSAWPGSYDVPTSQPFVGVGSPALILPAGGARVDTLDLDLRDLDQHGPEPRLVGWSGVLRVRIKVYARTNQFGRGDRVDLTELLSNPFRVRCTR